MKVLVADDSKVMLRIIINVLSRLKILDVDIALDGELALELFHKNKYDLILTDMNMPNKTGLELIKAVRTIDKEVPIIMITTEGGRKEVIEALKAGCNQYIVKPFTPDTLKEKLHLFILDN